MNESITNSPPLVEALWIELHGKGKKSFTCAETIDVEVPTIARQNDNSGNVVVGFRIQVSECPHASTTVGKAHCKVNAIMQNGSLGSTRYGKYFPTLIDAINMGNELLEKFQGPIG